MDGLLTMPVLPVIFAGIIAFSLLSYVICDGFDLGVGVLFLVERDRPVQNVMVSTITPVWDGNETWLVLGGAGLYGAFPAAYASVLPALYPLVILMLLGLIFRGVSFEFRFRATTIRQRCLWEYGFLGGSLLAGFCQGMMAGGLIQGIKVSNGGFSGRPLDFLTPFAVFCGIALVLGYALLGACWLYWRTSGALQERMRMRARNLGFVMAGLIFIATCWSAHINPAYFWRWVTGVDLLVSAIAPVALLLLGGVFLRHLRSQSTGRGDWVPFCCGLGAFLVCFFGLGWSFFPMIVPGGLTIWQAASPPVSQLFQLVGTCILLPMIVSYNVLAYWVFRGKVDQNVKYY